MQHNYDDATVACDGKLYPVHQLVLSTCSEYFEEMFAKTHGKHPVIVLKDIKKEVFEALLQYMYVGEVNVVQEKLSELIGAAECLKIKGLAVPDEEPGQSSHRANFSSKNKPSHSNSTSNISSNSSLQFRNSNRQISSHNAGGKRKDSSEFKSGPPTKVPRGGDDPISSHSNLNNNSNNHDNSRSATTYKSTKSLHSSLRDSQRSSQDSNSLPPSASSHASSDDDIAVSFVLTNFSIIC